MPVVGNKGTIEIFEDFLVDTLNADNTKTTVDAAGTAAIVADAIGGQVALTTDTGDNEMAEIALSQPVRAMDGPVAFEAKFQVNGVATIAFDCSLSDDPDEASNTLPVELSSATFTSNASTYAGVMFDTGATTDVLYFFAVDDDNDVNEAIATLSTGIAPVANTDIIVRIELFDRGSTDGMADAHIYVSHNGAVKKKIFERAVDRDCKLYAHIAVENRTTAARVLSVDYMWLKAGRA